MLVRARFDDEVVSRGATAELGADFEPSRGALGATEAGFETGNGDPDGRSTCPLRISKRSPDWSDRRIEVESFD